MIFVYTIVSSYLFYQPKVKSHQPNSFEQKTMTDPQKYYITDKETHYRCYEHNVTIFAQITK
jgi:hypothetical protein